MRQGLRWSPAREQDIKRTRKKHNAGSRRRWRWQRKGDRTVAELASEFGGPPKPDLQFPSGEGRLAVGEVRMPDAGLELELAIPQDRCPTRLPSCWGAWNG